MGFFRVGSGLNFKAAARLITLAAAVLMLAAPARAAEIVWLESCGLPQRTQDYLKRDMLLIGQAYRSMFNYSIPSNFHIDIHFFCTPEEFNYFLAKNIPKLLGSGVVGMYIAPLELMMVDARATDDPAAILLHETSHAYINAISGKYSLWLNEGLAETFETIDRQSSMLVLRPNEADLIQLRYMLQEKPSLLDIRRYVSVTPEAWRKLDRFERVGRRGAINYSRSISWGLVRFLIETPNGRKTLHQLILNGRAANPSPDAYVMNSIWPGGLSRMQSDFQAWIKKPAQNLTFPQIKVN